MTYSKMWRQAAREAMQEGLQWTPTNLPNYVQALKDEHYSSK